MSEFKFWLRNFLAEWLWASNFTSLNPRFLLRKMGTIISTSQGGLKDSVYWCSKAPSWSSPYWPLRQPCLPIPCPLQHSELNPTKNTKSTIFSFPFKPSHRLFPLQLSSPLSHWGHSLLLSPQVSTHMCLLPGSPSWSHRLHQMPLKLEAVRASPVTNLNTLCHELPLSQQQPFWAVTDDLPLLHWTMRDTSAGSGAVLVTAVPLPLPTSRLGSNTPASGGWTNKIPPQEESCGFTHGTWHLAWPGSWWSCQNPCFLPRPSSVGWSCCRDAHLGGTLTMV